ncbi:MULTISPECIES: hypothetical protein [Methylotenera]|uniref:hypothetical protein n=1 Tax=Methylotenera TaxID=359407 RepID=UPI00037BC47D|nr:MULTISPECIES: hypothetical protein [Methylotenera]
MFKLNRRHFNQHYLLWWITDLTKKLGLFGLLGSAIALGCCLFYAFNIVPIQQKKIEAESAISALNNQQKKQGNSQQSAVNATPTETSEENIQRFYAQFPNGESLPKWLRLIDENAVKQHLVLNRGDYKLTQIKAQKMAPLPNTKHPLSRYEIVLPVTGQYTQIRQFIAQVLHDLPALALSELHIKRENAQSPTVEARLIFVLLLKGESWQ